MMFINYTSKDNDNKLTTSYAANGILFSSCAIGFPVLIYKLKKSQSISGMISLGDYNNQIELKKTENNDLQKRINELEQQKSLPEENKEKILKLQEELLKVKIKLSDENVENCELYLKKNELYDNNILLEKEIKRLKEVEEDLLKKSEYIKELETEKNKSNLDKMKCYNILGKLSKQIFDLKGISHAIKRQFYKQGMLVEKESKDIKEEDIDAVVEKIKKINSIFMECESVHLFQDNRLDYYDSSIIDFILKKMQDIK